MARPIVIQAHKQLSYVVTFSLICSLLMALTIIPVLCSRYLHVEVVAESKHPILNHITMAGKRLLDTLDENYQQAIHWALDHRWTVITAAAALVAGTFFLVPLIGYELMPETDEGELRINLEMPTGTRIEVTDDMARRIEEIVAREIPESEHIFGEIGGGGWEASATHMGNIRVTLRPRADRQRSSQEIAAVTYGMYDEVIAFLPALCLLAQRARFDALTALAMSIGTASVAGTFSPIETFKLGIAQPLAEVPLFSGGVFRACVFVPAIVGWVGFVSWHASRVRRARLLTEGERSAADREPPARLTRRDIVVLAMLNGTMGLLDVGAAVLGWGLADFSTVMLGMGLAAGLAGGLGPARTARGLAEGFLDSHGVIHPRGVRRLAGHVMKIASPTPPSLRRRQRSKSRPAAADGRLE